VIYMGLGALAQICRELVAHGMAPDTPAAVVEQATTPRQRVVCGTLLTLPVLVQAEQLAAPALIVVGEVVRLHGPLGWFAGADTARGELAAR
jgi:siroheme synthase